MIPQTNWSLTVEEQLEGIVWRGPNLFMKASIAAHLEDQASAWTFRRRETGAATDGFDDCDVEVQDTFESGGCELTRQIVYNRHDMSAFHIRLLLANKSDKAVKPHDLMPIVIEGPGRLDIGQCEYARWSFLRQGRHKNDLPSACILGRKDGAYDDSLKGLHETTGTAVAGESYEAIISDELTVFKGHEGEGPGSLAFGYISGMSQLVACKLTSDPSRTRLERLELICQLDGIVLEPGEAKAGEWLRVDGNEDSFEAIDRYVSLKAQMLKSVAAEKAPSVFCTWYYYGETVTGQDVQDTLEGLAAGKVPIDVVQIDEGWEWRLGDWEANVKFPQGMKHTAELIAAAGYRPGIWTSPFIIDPRCEIRYYHPDWILKKADGSPALFPMNGMNNLVLDVSHPEVIDWLEQLYRKMTFEWGFTYHKLDFTRAVAIEPGARFHNRKATRAEIYRMGFEAIRKGAGPDAYILVCGGLYSPPAGLVDAHRTGSDVTSTWPQKKEESGETVAPFAIKQNVLRYWMNRLWHNDPDALMVRRRSEKIRDQDLSLGLLTDEEAATFTLNQYFGGGLVSFTEPVKEIERDRFGLLRHIVPSVGTAAVPRDLFTGRRYPNLYDTEVCPKAGSLPGWHTAAYINWEDRPVSPELYLNESLAGKFAKQHEAFYVTEFWSGAIQKNVKYGDKIEIGPIHPHASAIFKIVPYSANEPVLLYSNGHFSMGGTEITEWSYSGDSLRVGISWPWDYPVEFVIASPPNRSWQTEGGDREMLRIALGNSFEGTLEFKLK